MLLRVRRRFEQAGTPSPRQDSAMPDDSFPGLDQPELPPMKKKPKRKR